MDVTQLAATAGVVLSLVFSYVPGVKGWFDGLPTDGKRLVTGLSIIVVAGAVFGLTCGNVIGSTVACSKQGGLDLLGAVIAALVANQATFVLTKS
jgi:hypothetical protein